MARRPYTATTTDTLETIFEDLIVTAIEANADYIAAEKPSAWAGSKSAHLSEVSKPPCVVVAVERIEEAIPETGLWSCKFAIDMRLNSNCEGYGDAIFAALEGVMNREVIEVILNTVETVCVTGSLMYDQELSRELQGNDSSRVFAGRGIFGIVEPMDFG